MSTSQIVHSDLIHTSTYTHTHTHTKNNIILKCNQVFKSNHSIPIHKIDSVFLFLQSSFTNLEVKDSKKIEL